MDQAAYHHMAENEQSHWWFVARRRFIAHQLDKLKRPALKILEVGCGTGGNIDMLRGYGDLSVMELDPYAIKIAENRHDIKVVNGSLPDNHPFNPESFDLIVLFDVLEHIEADVEALQELKGLLKPGGRILLTVPAYQSLWSEHDKIHHHHRRYSRDSLRDVVENSGFEVSRMSNFFIFILPLALIRKFMGSVLKIRQTLEGQPPTLINNILKHASILETKISFGKGWPAGLSIYCELVPK